MARTTDQPSAATARAVGTDPAREANGHGPVGDEQGRTDPVGQPADTATATDTDRRHRSSPPIVARVRRPTVTRTSG